MKSGIVELGQKLGPINWQFAKTKAFDPEDFGAFLALLPKEAEGLPLRHVVEVRHESFRNPAFIALLKKHDVATVVAHSDEFPQIADVTAGFVYARLQGTEEKIETGYAPQAIAAWAERAKLWEAGGEPDDLERVSDKKAAKKKRDVFIYMISGAKVRAPAAAQALIAALG